MRYAVAFPALVAILSTTGCGHKVLRQSVIRSTFIFDGQVRQANASQMPDIVGAGRDTYIVRVDNVYPVSPAFQDYKGREVTVRLDEDSPLKFLRNGQPYVFLTSPLAIGSATALQGHARKPGDRPAGVIVQRDDLLLQRRVDLADTIALGDITEIRSIPPEIHGSSEHDPRWGEAVLTIRAYAKQRPTSTKVTILFPTNDDIVWYLSPRFDTEKKGILLLQSAERGQKVPKRGTQGIDFYKGKFTALHPRDFISGRAELPRSLGIRLKSISPRDKGTTPQAPYTPPPQVPARKEGAGK